MMIKNIRHAGVIYTDVSAEVLATKGVPQSAIDAALAEQKWSEIRTRRDALLRASDYAIMPDYPLTDDQKAEVTAYRQALRDIPETAAGPDAVEWPTKSECLTQ